MKKFVAIFLSATLLVFSSVGTVKAADILDEACSSKGAANSATCESRTKDNPLTGANGLLEKITNIVAIVAGVAAIIMIMVGGFRLITSSGDAQSATNARKSIVAAAIGLVVIVLARALIIFVIERFK